MTVARILFYLFAGSGLSGPGRGLDGTMRICVEGNIGSGKSTALRAVAAALPELTVIPEPVDEWGALLDQFYAEPSRWAHAFNLKVLAHFARVTAADAVIERSPSAGKHVFSQLGYNDGTVSQAAWDTYKKYHDLLGWEPDAYVFIDTPVATCMARVAERGRACEGALTADYLDRVAFQYENMLRFTEKTVVRVDGAAPAREVEAQVVGLVGRLLGRQRTM